MAKQRPESEACVVERRIYHAEGTQRKPSAGGDCRTLKAEAVPWFRLADLALVSRAGFEDKLSGFGLDRTRGTAEPSPSSLRKR